MILSAQLRIGGNHQCLASLKRVHIEIIPNAHLQNVSLLQRLSAYNPVQLSKLGGGSRSHPHNEVLIAGIRQRDILPVLQRIHICRLSVNLLRLFKLAFDIRLPCNITLLPIGRSIPRRIAPCHARFLFVPATLRTVTERDSRTAVGWEQSHFVFVIEERVCYQSTWQHLVPRVRHSMRGLHIGGIATVDIGELFAEQLFLAS
mmetsp:Transcript_29113/g.46145  ORF Transcript_29113/g.46145 Transcript_29113/m.46145 type:complete len:203 (-) Transcript_29113:522-1130(-)